MKALATLTALAALGLAAGCGMKGDLSRAAPVFGPERELYEAQRAAAEAQAAADAAAPKERQRMEIPLDPAAPAPAPVPAAEPTKDDKDKSAKPE